MENSYDTRYKSPKMRSRAQTGSSEPSENPMEKPAGAKGMADEKASCGYAPVAVFGGTPPQVDSEHTIKITAIDPESGEAEFEVMDSPETGEEQTEPQPPGESAEPTTEMT
jgi:hypothetical protein